MAVGDAPLAATMCMLTQTTGTQEKAGGGVMSEVISMHSGVAKLLGDKRGQLIRGVSCQLIKAKMGGHENWSGSIRESSKKVPASALARRG